MKMRLNLSPISRSFIQVSALTVLWVVSSSGCNQPLLVSPGSTPQTTALPSMPVNTPTSVPTTTSTPTLLPMLTETPIPSVTPPFPSTVSLTAWTEWQLKYDGEAAWSPDGQHIVFTDVNIYGLDDRTYMYDVDTLKLVWLVNVGMSSITFSPEGEVIVSSNSRIEFWDAATGELIDAPYEGNASLSAAFILGDDTLLVGRSWVLGFGVDTANTEIGVWDYKQKRLNIIIKNDGDITTFIVSPNGKLLATAFALLPDVEGGHGVFLWDLATKSNRCTFPGNDVAFSPTGDILAIIDNSLAEKGKVLLYDTNTCKFLKTFYQAEYIFGFAYSPDGQMLALVSKPEDTIRLLDATTGQLLYEQSGQWDTVWQLAFSPDGKFLMSLESYGTKSQIHIWKLTTAPIH